MHYRMFNVGLCLTPPETPPRMRSDCLEDRQEFIIR